MTHPGYSSRTLFLVVPAILLNDDVPRFEIFDGKIKKTQGKVVFWLILDT